MHAYWATFGHPGRRTHPRPFSTIYSPEVLPWFSRHPFHSYARTPGCCHISSGKFEPWIDSKSCRESTSGQTFVGTEAQCDYYQPLMHDAPPGELTRDEMMMIACQSGSNQHEPECQDVLSRPAPETIFRSPLERFVYVSPNEPLLPLSTETDLLHSPSPARMFHLPRMDD